MSLYEVFNKLCGIENFREDSYFKKTLEKIHKVQNPFSCPELGIVCHVPQSKAYYVLKKILLPQHIVEKIPVYQYPDDWDTYTKGQRKTYRQKHGLPLKGRLPDKYNYTPDRMLKYIEEKKNEKITEINREASNAISEINNQFETLSKIIESQGESER